MSGGLLLKRSRGWKGWTFGWRWALDSWGISGWVVLQNGAGLCCILVYVMGNPVRWVLGSATGW